MNAPAGVAPKIQINGKKLLMQLYMVIRTSRIHDAENNAVLVATENLKDTINMLWAALGRVQLQFVEDLVYLNDVRLRVDTGMADSLTELRTTFSERGLGGLSFSRPVDSASLKDFVILLGRPVESDDDASALRDALEQMKDLALELLGPKAFSDEGADEIQIDRKTFALQTYAKLVVAARETISAIRRHEEHSKGKLQSVRIIQDLVDLATERVNFLVRMSAIKQAGDYPANHAANTCLLSIILGKGLGVDRLKLVELGLSAFYASMPSMLLPPDLYDPAAELTEVQRERIREEMKRHIPRILGGARMTETVMKRMLVAYEHHESYADPDTGRRNELHTFSRIVAVASCYDALTTRRPWRSGYAPDEALRMLTKLSGTRYDPAIVKTLINLLGMYPLGTVVTLDTRETAVVYHNSNDPKLFTRPWVKVVRDASGNPVIKTTIRNLGTHKGPGATIVGTVPGSEIEGLDPAMVVAI